MADAAAPVLPASSRSVIFDVVPDHRMGYPASNAAVAEETHGSVSALAGFLVGALAAQAGYADVRFAASPTGGRSRGSLAVVAGARPVLDAFAGDRHEPNQRLGLAAGSALPGLVCH
jgi:hypothetical protein